MLFAFCLGLLLLLLIVTFLRSFVDLEPRKVLEGVKWAVLGLTITGVIALALMRQISLAVGLGAILFSFLRRTGFPTFGGSQGKNQGTSHSDVETAFLRMTLDHETGDLDGEVLAGQLAGRRLSVLDLEQILDLRRQFLTSCSQSARMVEAFLDRRHPNWRTDSGAADDESPPPPVGSMTRKDALRILGLGDDASEANIRAAHHRLIALVHPDRGGSGELAALVNRARDVLLGVDPSGGRDGS